MPVPVELEPRRVSPIFTETIWAPGAMPSAGPPAVLDPEEREIDAFLASHEKPCDSGDAIEEEAPRELATQFELTSGHCACFNEK